VNGFRVVISCDVGVLVAFLGLSKHGFQSFRRVREVWEVWVKLEMKHNWKLSDLVKLYGVLQYSL